MCLFFSYLDHSHESIILHYSFRALMSHTLGVRVIHITEKYANLYHILCIQSKWCCSIDGPFIIFFVGLLSQGNHMDESPHKSMFYLWAPSLQNQVANIKILQTWLVGHHNVNSSAAYTCWQASGYESRFYVNLIFSGYYYILLNSFLEVHPR